MNISKNNFYLNNFNEKNNINNGSDFELLDTASNENIIYKDEYLISLYKTKINITIENLKCFYLSSFSRATEIRMGLRFTMSFNDPVPR